MKEIKDFSGYFITEDGRVFSYIKKSPNGGIIDYTRTPKELKPNYNNKGYCRINLYNNGKMIKKSIHRLVAETYIPNPDNLPQVNHKDENKTNNHVSNLEWVTSHQNTIHSCCRWIWKIENIITGQVIETININQFSKDNNLRSNALHKTLTGKRNHHKNHKIISRVQFK